MPTLPIEYGKALIAKTEAWNEYQLLIDSEHTTAEYDEALEKAAAATNKATEWYHRWQAVGGTSDIESIEAAELEQEQHKALKIVLDVTAPKSDVDKWLDNLTPAELDFVNWVTSNEEDYADLKATEDNARF